MLDSVRLELLQRLLQTAVDDLSRTFTATWSTARLRTMLMHACLDRGQQVLAPAVPGTPAHANQALRAARPADLQAIPRAGVRPLAVDLLAGGRPPQGWSPSGSADSPWAGGSRGGNASNGSGQALTLGSVHRAIERVSSGAIDALLISADAQTYDRLFDPADGRSSSRLRQAVVGVLPRAANVAREKAHTCNLGDATMATVGREVRAFGITRVACAVYVLPY